jgi:hypothetical protein
MLAPAARGLVNVNYRLAHFNLPPCCLRHDVTHARLSRQWERNAWQLLRYAYVK